MKNSNQSLLSYELDLYKKLSDAENDRRHKFSDKAFKSITIIASFVGAVLWLIFKFLVIYQNECIYLQMINLSLLTGCCLYMIASVVIFFKMLYGYKDTHTDPVEIDRLIKEYKSQTEDEMAIIKAMDQTLCISYLDSAINNHKENENHIKLFESFYAIIFIEMFLLIITFLIEILI